MNNKDNNKKITWWLKEKLKKFFKNEKKSYQYNSEKDIYKKNSIELEDIYFLNKENLKNIKQKIKNIKVNICSNKHIEIDNIILNIIDFNGTIYLSKNAIYNREKWKLSPTISILGEPELLFPYYVKDVLYYKATWSLKNVIMVENTLLTTYNYDDNDLKKTTILNNIRYLINDSRDLILPKITSYNIQSLNAILYEQDLFYLFSDGSYVNEHDIIYIGSGISIQDKNGFVVCEAATNLTDQKFNFKLSQNDFELLSIVNGLEIARACNIKKVKIITDGLGAIKHILEYQLNNEKNSNAIVQRKEILNYISNLCQDFDYIDFHFIPREKNNRADVLSKLIYNRYLKDEVKNRIFKHNFLMIGSKEKYERAINKSTNVKEDLFVYHSNFLLNKLLFDNELTSIKQEKINHHKRVLGNQYYTLVIKETPIKGADKGNFINYLISPDGSTKLISTNYKTSLSKEYNIELSNQFLISLNNLISVTNILKNTLTIDYLNIIGCCFLENYYLGHKKIRKEHLMQFKKIHTYLNTLNTFHVESNNTINQQCHSIITKIQNEEPRFILTENSPVHNIKQDLYLTNDNTTNIDLVNHTDLKDSAFQLNMVKPTLEVVFNKINQYEIPSLVNNKNKSKAYLLKKYKNVN